MVHELRAAVATLRHNPGFTAAAVLTLGLGIGATTAMFSIVQGVLLNPLPYRDPDRLVRLSESHPGANPPVPGNWLSNLTFYAWEEARTIGPIGVYGSRGYTVGTERPVRLTGGTASPHLLDVLGLSPVVGRFFTADDAQPGAEPVVVVSEALWRERYGAAPTALGDRLSLDGRDHTIIGVAPAAFALPDAEARLWTVSLPTRPAAGTTSVGITRAIARLSPGATLEQAMAEGTAAARREPRPFVADMLFGKGGAVEVKAQRLIDEMTAGVRPALLVLSVAVACLLIIACANVANLLLSRGVSREREIAVRVAMGASTGRLIRQLLTESLVVSLAGASVGLALTWALVAALPAVAPPHLPRIDTIAIDWRVVGLGVALAVVSGTAAGLLPAIRGARPDLLPSLREGSGASSSARTLRLRRGLLVGEAAIAVVLLVGSLLLVRSFTRLVSVDAGYDAAQVLTSTVYLPAGRRAAGEALVLANELLPRLRQLPGVTAAGLSNMAPLGDSTYISGFTVPVAGREPITARGLSYWVTPGYAEALQLRLRAGRLLVESDMTASTQHIVVNQAFVDTFLADRDAVGVQFPAIGPAEKQTAEIVGVVGNVLKDGAQHQPQPELYLAISPQYAVRSELNLVVRTSASVGAAAADIRAIIGTVRPDLAVENVETLSAQLSESVAQPRFAASLLTGLAGLAVLLSAIGLYSVLAYSVSRRQREIGVRTALGASRLRVIGLVCREGLTVTALGLLVGLAAAAGVTQLMQAMLFGIEPLDPWSFAGAGIFLLAVCAVAIALPARRAARTDPASALRCE